MIAWVLVRRRTLRTKCSRRLASLLVALATTAAARPAAAGPREPIPSPTPADLQRAKDLYAEGRELYLRGNWGGAIVAFEYSYELSGDPNLLYNISLCYDRLAAYEQSIEYMTYYRDLAPPEEHADIDAQIHSLRVREQAKKAEGTPSNVTALLDPGTSKGPADDEGPKGPRVLTPASIAMLTIGATGFAVAAGTGPASLIATKRVRRECADSAGVTLCHAASADDKARARQLAIATDVALAVGGAAAIAFVALLAVRVHRIRTGQVSLAPTAGGAMVSVRF